MRHFLTVSGTFVQRHLGDLAHPLTNVLRNIFRRARDAMLSPCSTQLESETHCTISTLLRAKEDTRVCLKEKKARVFSKTTYSKHFFFTWLSRDTSMKRQTVFQANAQCFARCKKISINANYSPPLKKNINPPAIIRMMTLIFSYIKE